MKTKKILRNTSKYRNAPPKASAMLEALRGLGYSPATALADLIDNAIAAKATEVKINFVWEEKNSRISIMDNGLGMDASELDLAMRLGEKNPLDSRSEDDLGRFGLGLKTASFSQCRRLTVVSRKKDLQTECLRWDLDVLASSQDNSWRLLEGSDPESTTFLYPLEEQLSGTLVLWEKLDRMITPGFASKDFLRIMDTVEKHLSMTFHRYLESLRPRLKLFINGEQIKPWDPFLSQHSATQHLPGTSLTSGSVKVRAYILPHKDKLTPAEYESAGGLLGWTAQQGFYVYRNERLLVSGDWLGLGKNRAWTQEEAHKLTRIRLDLPNTADSDWKLDIRKSTARPPAALRSALRNLAEDARTRARRVFAWRGKPVSRSGKQDIAPVWTSYKSGDHFRYRIDPGHPLIADVLDSAGLLAPQIKAMLRVIEETVPVQRIWLDTTEAHNAPVTHFADDPPEEVRQVLIIYYRSKISKGMSSSMAKERMLKEEPFCNYPDLIAALPENP